MQVTAFSTPGRPEWRWRICNYGGETIEESNTSFPTIAAAVGRGTERLGQMEADDRSTATHDSWTTARRRGR